MFPTPGLNDTNSLNIVECYDPQTDEWTELPSMTYNRDGHAVTVCDDLIYAIGMYLNIQPTECDKILSMSWISQLGHPIYCNMYWVAKFVHPTHFKPVFIIQLCG